MQKPRGYDSVAAQRAGEFPTLPAGGYVCRITGVREALTRDTQRPKIEVSLDIAEGPYHGFYAKRYESDSRPNKKWGAVMHQTTENANGECSPYFKGFITSVEESNPGFAVPWDATFAPSFKGKLVGVVFRREEYMKQDGTFAWATKPWQWHSVKAIRDGVEVPEDKYFESARGGAGAAGAVGGFEDASSLQLPF